MKRQEWVIILAAAVLLGFAFTVTGNAGASMDGLNSSLKAGLVNTTSGQASVQAANPWDNSCRRDQPRKPWTAPEWSLVSVGAVPLRNNHPLHSRPNYCGENRHKVMQDNGWYYANPGNEQL